MNHSVFGRRVRADNGDGEEIGLSIATELAASMGGTLVIADELTTVFDLTLPRQPHPSLIPVRSQFDA